MVHKALCEFLEARERKCGQGNKLEHDFILINGCNDQLLTKFRQLGSESEHTFDSGNSEILTIELESEGVCVGLQGVSFVFGEVKFCVGANVNWN